MCPLQFSIDQVFVVLEDITMGQTFLRHTQTFMRGRGLKGPLRKMVGENKVFFIFVRYCFRQFWQMNGLFCGFHVNKIKLEANYFFQNFVKKLMNLNFSEAG